MFLPILGCLFLIPCYLLWRCGVRHYKSTGS
jgi:ABC-2 type transport system permease protein